ncbi:cadherin-87A-like [Lingula anatina]|uniref:Cadherin-87A-like n=1 Tax=Lingula anatina TaxID=7574 RepID=A0A1S3I3V9_LINAN|nr:cadherin-87A-like [Lingula anatina]|eukprot:XP_013392044.1 cadherin-87A-like [Lingula anatina]
MVEVQDYNAEKPADQRANTTVFLIIQQTQGGNPTFDAPWSEVNPKLYFSLSESSTGVGAEVTTLGATDPSDGSRITNFEKVPSSDPLDYFVVDRTSGRVTLKKNLDYDAMVRKEVNVLVRAIGKNITQFSTAELILRVTDANDNNPVFLERGYSFSISENPNSVFIGRVQASDKDDGDFGRVFYSISGQGADNFYINPQTGEIRLADGATLDRETTQEYTLIVSAADNANGSSTSRNDEVSLKIKVIDYNDHAPEFERSVYQFFKYDNLEAQRSIGVVSAKDNDEGNNGQIIYTINSGNENGMFQLDPQTGLLTSGTPLTGRARDQPYTLQVKAEDRGSPIPLSNYATIQVTIRPSLAADSKPRFEVPERDGVQFNITEVRRRDRVQYS